MKNINITRTSKWMFMALLSTSLLFTGCQKGNSNIPVESGTAAFETPGQNIHESTTGSEEGNTSIPDINIGDPSQGETTTGTGESASESASESAIAPQTEPPTESVAAPVNGYVVVLDPGHGGVYLGATYDGRQEKELTLRTAKYAKSYLEDNYSNVTVYLTRDTDTQFSLNEKEDLEARVAFGKQMNADIFVSLHFNSEPMHTTTGSLVLVSKQNWVTNQCQALGNSILDQLIALGLGSQGCVFRDSNDYFDENGVPLDYYAICRHSAANGIPGIIVEHCFMDNPSDEQFLDTEEDVAALGRADAIGIAGYLGLMAK